MLSFSLVIVFFILITFRFVGQTMFWGPLKLSVGQREILPGEPVTVSSACLCFCFTRPLLLLFLRLSIASYLASSLFLPDTAVTVWLFGFNLICPF